MTGQPLPGFRDFFPPEHAALRGIFQAWREASRCGGFTEYEGPELESLELYTEKSGDEIVGQLYHFTDKGDRQVALRPEMTPTLARMVASQHRNYRKPIKWFSVPRLFRYERPQKGRHREHYQWNCDIVGEKSPMAEAELIGVLCLGLSLLGLGPKDVVVKVSDRSWWDAFLEKQGVGETERPTVLRTLDRLESATTEQRREKLGALAGAVEAVWEGKSADSEAVGQVRKGVEALGYGDWCETDYRVVRGLAYYTGVVFEVHDRAGKLRAVAGGGRYDDLLKRLGGEDLPAVGFGMGDAVLAELLREKKITMPQAAGAEIFIVAEAKEQEMALQITGQLRRSGFSVDFDPGAGKWGKQLEMAEAKGARWALLVGREVGEGRLGLKELASRKQSEIRWKSGTDGKICLEPTPGEWAKVCI
ncbi:MAG: histidine--tRNA ligase [Candidatus Pacebacteria bacterium]|nr:histidine--tRNA ligase [Candidatus Paceibacterota bacterium]